MSRHRTHIGVPKPANTTQSASSAARQHERPHTRQPQPRRVEPPKPTVTLTPGLQLLRAVDAALSELQEAAAADPDGLRRTMRRVNANLHGALAHTAAIGETCMVAAAVQAVHVAEDHLTACELSSARAALATAKERLRVPVPRPRDAR